MTDTLTLRELTVDDLKLGRSHAVFPVGLSPLHRVMTLPTASTSFAGPPAFNYPMLGNDRVGDCTFAGFVHLVQAICLLLGVTPPDPSTTAVVKAYFVFTHGQDSGAVEATLLHTLYTVGILDIKIVGYARGVKGIPELLSVTQAFGASYLGIMVPATMQPQFLQILKGQIPALHLTGTPADKQIMGGHCVVSVAFDQAANTADILTWGARVKCELTWLDAYLDEHWAVIPSEVKAKGELDNVDWTQLEAELHSLDGPVGAAVGLR